MGRNFLLRQLSESISKIPQLVFNVWFAVTTAQSGTNPLEEFILDNHDGMGQVRLLVGSCGRHAMTTGPTHTVATQGTHFHHMEMAASVNHNVRELCQRTVTLPRREHLAGGPKHSIHATQVRGIVSCKYTNGVSLHMSLTYCCHCSVAQRLPNSTVNNHLRRWPIPSFHLPRLTSPRKLMS